MSEFLSLANARLLLLLNGALVAHPDLYRAALFVTDEGADLLTLLLLLRLWFWPEPRREQLLAPMRRDARGTSLLARFRERGQAESSLWRGPEAFLTREESRAQLITVGLALMSGYVIARLMALTLDIDRPFMTYLPVRSPLEGTFEDLRTYGSFPSDHAVLLAGLPVALAYWNTRWAWIAAGVAIVLNLVRIAVGFHYPGDMVGGALVGIVCVWTAMAAYHRRGRLHQGVSAVARGFDLSNSPYCFFLYAFLLLVGVEFAMHFKHVLELLFSIHGDLTWRFKNSGS